MKHRQNSNLGVLQSSVQHVLNLVSIFLQNGLMIQRGMQFSHSSKLVLITSRWLYTRSIVIDGNFTADHLKMKRPEEDIALSPGGRYMVEPQRYEAHLKTGQEIKQVCILLRFMIKFLMCNYTEITVL